MTSLAHRKGMTAGIVEERQRVLALIDGGLSLERLRVAIFDGESAEEFEGVVAARDGTNPSADLQPILSPSVRDSVLEEAAQRLEYRWQMFADQNRMQMAQTVHEDIEAIRALKSSPCAGTGDALVKRARDAAQRCHRPVLTAEDRIDLQVVFLDCAAALSTGVGRRGSGTRAEHDDLSIGHEAADEIERAQRLIRKLCSAAPDSPGCLWPECDCGSPR